MTEKFEDTKKV